MKIFKLTGKESVMSLHLEHPMHLNGEYKLALTGFYSDNNIANLTGEGKIFFQLIGSVEVLTFERKYWTLGELESKCVNFIQELLDKKYVTGIDPKGFKISITGQRIAITSPLGFLLGSSMCKLLGFDSNNKSAYNANVKIIGTNEPKLRPVDVIEIHCNLVEHSFVNHNTHWHKHDQTEILYQFFPNVPHGYKISEMPNEFHYIPLRNITAIREIKIMIKDQDNQLLVNDGVNNIVYLNLVKA